MQQSTSHLPKEPQDLPKEPQDSEQAREEIGVFLIIQTYPHKTGHMGRRVSLPFDPDCASLTKLRTWTLLLLHEVLRMPTGSIKGSTLLVYLDTESNQTLNLFVMKKKKKLVAVVGTCKMEHVLLAGTAVSCHTW
jgi:hypothetical protein